MIPLVIDVSDFVAPITDATSAVVTQVPLMLAAIAVVPIGLLVFRIGLRVIRSTAK